VEVVAQDTLDHLVVLAVEAVVLEEALQAEERLHHLDKAMQVVVDLHKVVLRLLEVVVAQDQ
jgi:hypothetical protein